MASLQEKLALLPDDLRALVRGLPVAKQAEIIEQLLQATELNYRALTKADVDTIRARTAQNSAFGFLSADVDITWQELQKPGYIALGAFDQQEEGGPEVPVAFVIAEASRLDGMQEVFADLDARPPPEESPSPPSHSHTQQSVNEGTRTQETVSGNATAALGGEAQGVPQVSEQGAAQRNQSETTLEGSGTHIGDNSNSGNSGNRGSISNTPGNASGEASSRSSGMQQLLTASGWAASDMIVSIYYVGVDYEYRRQGIGKQLLDLVKEVAVGARARMMWLTVAEWNPNALQFYLKYGFERTQVVKKGIRGDHLLLVYPLDLATRSIGARQGKAKKKRSGGGGGGGKGKKGFGAVAHAVTHASLDLGTHAIRQAPSWGLHPLRSGHQLNPSSIGQLHDRGCQSVAATQRAGLSRHHSMLASRPSNPCRVLRREAASAATGRVHAAGGAGWVPAG